MKWINGLFFSVLTLGLAAPATAHASNFDSEQPGSVLVFPRFITGNFNDTTVSGQAVHAVTEIEISVVCPEGATCAQDVVRMRAYWVCPGSTTSPCAATSFNLETTVGGSLFFNPEGTVVVAGVLTANAFPSNATTVIPRPPCVNGYLIVWVVDEGGNAIKFDGLIGDAIIRGFTATTARGYNAIPIQAVEFLATGDRTDQDGEGDLDFDETEYRKVTGRIYGTVRYSNFLTPGRANTVLTLLTLDVAANRVNPRTDVGLNFYTADEQLVDTGTGFFCYTDVLLGANTGFTTFTQQQMGRKGLLESTFAEQTNVFGNVVPVTLLGLVETVEFNATGTAPARDYAYSLYHDSTGVNTQFRP
jgi:hypothetical protein